jgi:hypothetical protein
MSQAPPGGPDPATAAEASWPSLTPLSIEGVSPVGKGMAAVWTGEGRTTALGGGLAGDGGAGAGGAGRSAAGRSWTSSTRMGSGSNGFGGVKNAEASPDRIARWPATLKAAVIRPRPRRRRACATPDRCGATSIAT